MSDSLSTPSPQKNQADIQNLDSVHYQDIPNHPGYRVGDDGSIWSCRLRSGLLSNTWHLLSPKLSKRGYRTVVLRLLGKCRHAKVGVLVLESFVGPRPPGLVARHLNDIKNDDRLTNLAWGTHSQNNHDAVRNGVHPMGETHGATRLTADQVREMRRLRRDGWTLRAIGDRMGGLSKATVSAIVTRRNWKYLAD